MRFWDKEPISSERPTVPVSVVMPVFNSEKTLFRAIASIAAQSSLPMELFLVDDGSSDASVELCREAAHALRTLFPVHVLAQEQNHGPAFARNIGWDSASGIFVAFLDADDSWHPNKLRIQTTYIECNADIHLCGHLCGLHQASPAATFHTERLTPRRMLLSNPFSTPTVMLRKALPHRFNSKMRHAEDYHLWLRIALDGLGVARLETELSILHKARYGGSGLSGDLWKMEAGELNVYRKIYQEQRIPLSALAGLLPLSLLKFAKRLLVSTFRAAIQQ